MPEKNSEQSRDRRRAYTPRTYLFIIIGMVIMVALHFAAPQKTQLEQTPTASTEEKPPVTAVAPDAPVIAPHKPDFAPPMEFSMMAPLVPFKEYETEESEIEPLWIKNAVESNVPKDKPRVVIIIDDMGMDKKHTRAVMDLPAPLTLAFLPYAEGLKQQTAYGRSKGHELMVHVPMEPVNGALDSGPEVLRPDQSPADFAMILNDDLSAFDGYVGINNHMGSKMTQDRPGMARVMAELKKRGLLFVDSRTINHSVAADEAKKAGVPYATRDIFLDHEETSEFAVDALDQVEKKALKSGLAIAIGHPKENTINALKAWLPTLTAKGISVIPISAAVTVPAGANETPMLPSE